MMIKCNERCMILFPYIDERDYSCQKRDLIVNPVVSNLNSRSFLDSRKFPFYKSSVNSFKSTRRMNFFFNSLKCLRAQYYILNTNREYVSKQLGFNSNAVKEVYISCLNVQEIEDMINIVLVVPHLSFEPLLRSALIYHQLCLN